MLSFLLLAPIPAILAGQHVYKSTSTLGELSSCLSAGGVPVFTPKDEEFERNRQVWQRRRDLQHFPAGIAVPESIEQVATAVQCSARYHYKVIARSGGHSDIAGSLGAKNGSLIVDLRHFDDIVWDEDTFRIGAGRHLGPTLLAIDGISKGRYTLPSGGCPAIGIGVRAVTTNPCVCDALQSLSHGGYGLLIRSQGLALDHIVAYQAVLANGSIVTAQEGSDLFWALQGSASSFAIVTDFHVRPVVAPPQNTMFRYLFETSPEEAVKAFMTLQEWTIAFISPEFGLTTLCIHGSADLERGRLRWSIEGVFSGQNGVFQTRIGPLLQRLPMPVVTQVDTDLNWIQSMGHNLTSDGIRLDLKGYHHRQAQRKRHIMLVGDFPERAMRAVFALHAANAYRYQTNQQGLWCGQHISRWRLDVTQRRLRTSFDLLGGLDSAFNQMPASRSSFATRDAKWLMWTMINNEDGDTIDQQSIRFQDQVYGAVKGNLGWDQKWGLYLNYAEPEADLRRYDGANYERLVDLKRYLDPHNLLASPLTIQA